MKINCIEFSPDGQIFVTGSDDSLLKVFNKYSKENNYRYGIFGHKNVWKHSPCINKL